MLVFPTLILGTAAIMGVILAFGHFLRNRPPLFSVGLIHGIVGLIGVIALIYAVDLRLWGPVTTALMLFVVTTVLGIVMFPMRLRRKLLPNSLIIVHALFAVVGYVFLCIGLVQYFESGV